MSQQQFEQYMQEQSAAIEASELSAEEWIEQHAEEFRATWEKDHQ
jgi:hypothetical protein